MPRRREIAKISLKFNPNARQTASFYPEMQAFIQNNKFMCVKHLFVHVSLEKSSEARWNACKRCPSSHVKCTCSILQGELGLGLGLKNCGRVPYSISGWQPGYSCQNALCRPFPPQVAQESSPAYIEKGM